MKNDEEKEWSKMSVLTIVQEETRKTVHKIDRDEFEAVNEAERRLDEIYAGRVSTTPLSDIAKRYGVAAEIRQSASDRNGIAGEKV